jgi:hypothetical protein
LQRKIEGTDVYDVNGKKIGEVDHLMMDKVSGRVAYAVPGFGGFLGLGHSHYSVPRGALTYDASLDGYRTTISQERLKDAPQLSDDPWSDRDWESRTHTHYDVRPYR